MGGFLKLSSSVGVLPGDPYRGQVTVAKRSNNLVKLHLIFYFFLGRI